MRRVICVVAVLPVILVGCGGDDALDQGPLGSPSSRPPSRICLSESTSSRFTLGWTIIQNSGSEKATLDSVSLEAANNVAVIDSSVLPTTGNSFVGFLPTYPPETPDHPGVNPPTWQNRAPVKDAPVPSGQAINLIVGVVRERPAVNAEVDGVSVFYHVGSRRYVRRYDLIYLIVPLGAKCPGALT